MRGATVEEQRDIWLIEVESAKAKEKPAKSMDTILGELKGQKLLSKEEVEEIKANANNEITIGSKTISFKIEDYEAPEPPVEPEEPEVPLGDGTWTGTVNSPKLMEGMTAVYWDGTGKEIKQTDPEFKKEEWYNYDSQKWANAITKDGSYWVWIPRYEYKITTPYTAVASEIKVNFIRTDTTTGTNEYKVHPAFTTDIDNGGWDKDLSGIWVAKYVAGYQKNTTDIIGSIVNESDTLIESDKKYTAENGLGNALGQIPSSRENVNISYPVFKPLTYTYNIISVGDIYTITQEIDGKDISGNTISKAKNFYGLNPDKTDSHMMKNSEWGMVAYLTQSKYGRNETEITINSKKAPYNSSKNTFAVTGYANSTANGVEASTTNNKTGIFDLSGCVWECTAGYILNPSGADSRTKYAKSFAEKTTSTKYRNSVSIL